MSENEEIELSREQMSGDERREPKRLYISSKRTRDTRIVTRKNEINASVTIEARRGNDG